MKLSQFKFNLPDELIASHPLAERDQARLMVVNRPYQAKFLIIFSKTSSIFSTMAM